MVMLTLTEKDNSLIDDQAQQLNCYATIDQIQQWQELLDCYARLKQQHSKQYILLLLEDIAQCNYTSMHASQSEQLYFDASMLMEGQEHPVWENISPAELQYHRQQLLSPSNQVTLEQLTDKFNYDDDDYASILRINQSPLEILEDIVEVKLVAQVAYNYEKFAAQINGYFSCDLNPFECFALIRSLEQDFALEYIGLGANLLFFIKTPDFDVTKLEALFAHLDLLYHFPQTIKQQLQQQLLQQPHLILPYVESLEIYDFE